MSRSHFSGNLPAERHVEGRVAFGVADVDVDAAGGRTGVVVQEQLEHLEGYIKVYWVGIYGEAFYAVTA